MKTSAGLLLFRRSAGGVELLLGHMGGPLWARKEAHAWSIPKGLYQPDGAGAEDPLAAAEREFAEELGAPAPSGETGGTEGDGTGGQRSSGIGTGGQRSSGIGTVDLGTVRASGKAIRVFAREGDFDAAGAVSNTFTMEWPPKSGSLREFPEIDRAAWFDLSAAAEKLVKGQLPFLARLAAHLAPS